jgi:transposase
MMSLRPEVPTGVPQETARVASAAFPHGSMAMRIRDHLGPMFTDEAFAGLFSARGQPAVSPGQLALVSVLQHVENLSDRQAAHAVRGRIDWKYLLVRHEAPPIRAGVKGSRLRPVAAGWGS